MAEVPPEPEIRVLGELVVISGGRSLPLPASKKTRALLGYLAVTGRPHTRERLCELLWQGPDDPRAALRWSLTKLRAVLGPRALQADRERVGLSGVTTDLAAVRSVLLGDHAARDTAELIATAERFGGELCEGLSLPDCYGYQEWHTAERQAARALHVSLLTTLVERFASDPEQALIWARQRVAIEPLSETAHAAVVRCLAMLGRKREALAQYAACMTILEQELGARPTRELLEARMQIGARIPGSTPSRAGDPPAPPQTEPKPAPEAEPLHGREPELSALGDALERARSGESAGVLFIFGEPGIGKSRLLEELARRAVALGGTALVGRAFEPEMVRPYGPWVDALRALPTDRVPDALRPELSGLLPGLGGDGATDRASLFEAVARLLAHLAGTAAAILVVLDDAHWFDEASAALLHYVARASQSSHVLIACAARPGELSDNAAALRMLRGLGREARSRAIELGPLDAEAVAAIALKLSPGVDAQRIVRESGGNPLLALELARVLGTGDPSAWHSLGGLIAERLGRLEPAALELLCWAAAIGKSFDLALLERVTGAQPMELVSRMGELERHGLLRASADGRGFDFAHDLLRDGAYQKLSEPRRRVVHRTIARALAPAGNVDVTRASEIARHAALGGEAELAARAALAGALHCLRLLANEEAVRLADLGLTQLGPLARDDALRLRVELWSVHVFAGSPFRELSLVQSELSRAVLEAHDAGLGVVAASGFHALSVLQFDHGDLSAAHLGTRRAMEAARDAGPKERAEQLGASARCLAVLERDLDDANAMYREARALSKDAPSTPAIEQAGGYLALYAGRLDEARALFERALALARKHEDCWSEFESLRALVQLELEAVPQGDALARCPELLEVAAKMREGSELPAARAIDALCRFCRGSDRAREALDEAVAALRVADAKGVLAYVLGLAGEHDFREGRLELAEQRASEALRAAETVSRKSQAALARALLARIALARRDLAEARRQVSALLPESEQRALSARARSKLQALRAELGAY